MEICIRPAQNGYIIFYSDEEDGEFEYVAETIAEVLNHTREMLLFDNQEIDMSHVLTDIVGNA